MHILYGLSNCIKTLDAFIYVEYPKDKFYSFNDPSENASNNAIIQLLNLNEGNHYLLLYPNISIIRKIYAGYIGSKLKDNYVEILFFTYYDSTDKVREILISHGLDVRNYEKNGLTLIDHAAEIKNGSLTLNDFADKIQNYRQNQKNKLFVIADMSIHNHSKDTSNLLSLEKSLPSGGNWKQLCLYHQLDFDRMFTDEQKQQIFSYHKDKTIII